MGAPTAADPLPLRLRASQRSPTRRHPVPPGAPRSAESRRLSARQPLGRSLGESGSASAAPSPPSRGAGRGDRGIPPRPERRRAHCEQGGEGGAGRHPVAEAP